MKKSVTLFFIALILIAFAFSFAVVKADDNDSNSNSGSGSDSENSDSNDGGVSVTVDSEVKTESDNSGSSNGEEETKIESETEVKDDGRIETRQKVEVRTADGARIKYELRERQEFGEEERRQIIREEHKLEIRERLNRSECPLDCECSGSTIKCEITDSDTNQTRRELTIHAGRSGNTIIQIKGFNASTNVTLYKSDDGRIYGIFRGNETRRIILPDEVRDRIRARIQAKLGNESINLTEDGKYEVQARKEARLFFLFKVRERINAQVDSETGEVLNTRNPWWGFLARDVKLENDTEVEAEVEAGGN